MFKTRFWPMTARPISPKSQLAFDMLPPDEFAGALGILVQRGLRLQNGPASNLTRGQKRISKTAPLPSFQLGFPILTKSCRFGLQSFGSWQMRAKICRFSSSGGLTRPLIG